MRYLCRRSEDCDTPCFVMSRFNEPALRYQICSSEELELPVVAEGFSKDFRKEEEMNEAYRDSLSELIAELKKTGGKTVISRVVSDHTDLSPEEIFARLCAAYPAAAVCQWQADGGRWFAATPELLLHADAERLQTMSLAGTRPANSTTADWSRKNKQEQQMVTDFILSTLRSLNLSPEAQVPCTLQAGPVEHICTRISAPRKDADPLTVAEALSPTPAVAGLPREESLKRISRIEQHPRAYYAGFFGLLDAEESNFFVTLRCMKLSPSGAVGIYVGGGITADSTPEAEWDETCNKAHTLLSILH